MEPSAAGRGKAVAAALSGPWRRLPEPLAISGTVLARITPLLLEQGAGGLVWRRLMAMGERLPTAASALRHEARRLLVQSYLQEDQLCRAVSCLRAGGVEPLLIKGWSVARLYAARGLRPLGDIDLCVRPDLLDTAAAALTKLELPFGLVDLHGGIPDLPARAWDDIYHRSRLVPLGDVEVRILGPEDLLRLLCLHFVRHECYRPLWLCDVAATLESLPADFDWDYCLTGKRRIAQWVLCVVGLAQRLLGAQVEPAHIAARADRLPWWVVPAVLWRWGATMPALPFHYYARHPSEIPAALLYRTFNPIKISYWLRMPPHRSWLLLQLAYLLTRPLRLLARLGHGLARMRFTPTGSVAVHSGRMF
jgi:hypothetical protein